MNEQDQKGLAVDSSDSIFLSPEDWLFSVLLDMVLAHCNVPGDKIDSFVGYPAHVRAMRLLAEAGFIEIESESAVSKRLVARISLEGQELTARAEAAYRQKFMHGA